MEGGRSILPGLAWAAGGTSLWGLSFVVPAMMRGITPWDVSLGRYIVFGLLAALLLALGGRRARPRLKPRDWGAALVFSVTGYYGCYTVMVYAIEVSGVALPTLVMGLSPVSVALAGSLRGGGVSITRLIGPLSLVGAGLGVVNLARHGGGLSVQGFWPGLLLSLLALAMLTHFLVYNQVFLRKRPYLTPVAWSNAMGLTLLGLAVIGLCARLALGGGLPWEGTPTTAWGYGAGCLVLGVGASWLGAVLWSKANLLLPPALCGQSIVFWPLSGLAYGCMLQGRLPSAQEGAGIALVFAGILWGIRAVNGRRECPVVPEV